MAMPVLERLVPILSAPLGQMPRSIMENSAITLGRCAPVGSPPPPPPRPLPACLPAGQPVQGASQQPAGARTKLCLDHHAAVQCSHDPLPLTPHASSRCAAGVQLGPAGLLLLLVRAAASRLRAGWLGSAQSRWRPIWSTT